MAGNITDDTLKTFENQVKQMRKELDDLRRALTLLKALNIPTYTADPTGAALFDSLTWINSSDGHWKIRLAGTTHVII